MTIELTFQNVYQESSEAAVGEIFKTPRRLWVKFSKRSSLLNYYVK